METGVWIALGGLALTVIVYAVRAGGATATVKRDTEANGEAVAKVDQERKACREQMERKFEKAVNGLHERVDDLVKESGKTNKLVAGMEGKLDVWMDRNGKSK